MGEEHEGVERKLDDAVSRKEFNELVERVQSLEEALSIKNIAV